MYPQFYEENEIATIGGSDKEMYRLAAVLRISEYNSKFAVFADAF
jgi:hypothetical protein